MSEVCVANSVSHELFRRRRAALADVPFTTSGLEVVVLPESELFGEMVPLSAQVLAFL